MKIKELKKLLIEATQKYVSRTEAEYFANEVIETEIRKPAPDKKYQHDIIKDIKSWTNKVGAVRKSIDLPGYTQFNFEGRGPSLKIKEIHGELEKKARLNGIAMVSIINSAGMHVLHLWAQGLAKRGLFAIGCWNGGPDAVVPFNGTRGLLGTNPLTYGFPGDRGDIVVDMATSEIPYFKIVAAKKDNTPLPPDTAVNSDGEITIDPNEALEANGISNLLPMGGGYKGYNINYLMEIMTSALIGARSSPEMSDEYIETEHGGLIIAVDISRVTNQNKYNASIKSLNEEIRNQKAKKGAEKVLVPGDNNLEKIRGITDETEIEVDEDYLKELESLAKS
ncbi:MAG: Ldh family oxidoreductase [Candidatus Vogelbacteria bacterium]|nr:Ldh family oxidoreductase [Candidatus Vogelbacteria bacterium]